MDGMIESTATRIFSDHGEDTVALWQALEHSRLTRAWLSEEQGGADLSALDVFGLMRVSGLAARPVPFTETLLAGFLLSQSGIDVPAEMLSVALGDNSELLDIPFGATTGAIAVIHGAHVQLLELHDKRETATVGGDPEVTAARSDATILAQGSSPNWLTQDVFQHLCALARAAQMCGAMQGALGLTIDYTSQREQFGRPLSKFQAIQHMVSEMAGELAASQAALSAAIETVTATSAPDFRAIAAAKIRASEAAGIVAAHAQQAHGAIGYTSEYDLARFTRRLWRWREQFGSETDWAIKLGRDVARASSKSLTIEVFGEAHD